MLKCGLCYSEMEGHGYTPITCSECKQVHDRDDDLHMVLDMEQVRLLQDLLVKRSKKREELDKQESEEEAAT